MRGYTLGLVACEIAIVAACTVSVCHADILPPPNPNNEVLMERPASNLEVMEAFSPDNRYRLAGRAVGRLVIDFGDNRKGFCTGSLITVNYVLTANHCLHDEEFPDNHISAITLYMDDVASDRGTPFVVVKEPVESDATSDYAILRVEGNPGSSFPPLTLDGRVLQRGEELFVVHHPEGEPQYLTRRVCRVRGPAQESYNFLHQCDTLKGSSGAPIMSDNSPSPIVLGLHIRFQRLDGRTLNVGTRMESIAARSCIVTKLLNHEPVAGCPSGLAASLRGQNAATK